MTTIRADIVPSKRIVAMAGSNFFLESILVISHSHQFAKIIAQNQDLDRLDMFLRLACVRDRNSQKNEGLK
jgi:hypothetical protein